MTVVRIPTSTVSSSYVQRTALDGREYRLYFQWNQREGKWYLGIRDQDDDPLVLGLKLVAQLPLLTRQTDPRLPQGQLIAVDTTAVPDDGKVANDPGLNDLGSRVVLLYYPVEDIAAL